jgi:multiple sugar transport system ATP-binding protein
MTTITIQHVSKRFAEHETAGGDAVTALDDVSLKIGNGEVVALIGPSGCGKSTLLRCVAGLVQPDAGEILYDKEPLGSIPIESRGIGMVFQEGALAPHWEAGKTIGFFLWLRRREHEVPERVHRISQITGFGLDALLDRRPGQLSGGERQRVAVARALVRDPRVFLFDEPFSHLDAKLRLQAKTELRRLLNEFPVTSIYVTHDQLEAVALAHRVVVMRAGRIEQIGTYETLHDNPVNLFVAQFVGTPSINIFEGRVQAGRWSGRNFSGVPVRRDLADWTPALLGVRPADVRLVAASDPVAVAATVRSVTPYFSERFQLLDVEGAGEHWSVAAPANERFEQGDRVYCAVNAEKAFLFDTSLGHRIG